MDVKDKQKILEDLISAAFPRDSSGRYTITHGNRKAPQWPIYIPPGPIALRALVPYSDVLQHTYANWISQNIYQSCFWIREETKKNGGPSVDPWEIFNVIMENEVERYALVHVIRTTFVIWRHPEILPGTSNLYIDNLITQRQSYIQELSNCVKRRKRGAVDGGQSTFNMLDRLIATTGFSI